MKNSQGSGNKKKRKRKTLSKLLIIVAKNVLFVASVSTYRVRVCGVAGMGVGICLLRCLFVKPNLQIKYIFHHAVDLACERAVHTGKKLLKNGAVPYTLERNF